MVSPDSTTEESQSSFSDESPFYGESQKTLHRRSSSPHQATPFALPLSESKSDEVRISTPPPKADHQQQRGKKKKQSSNKGSFSDESENTLHSRSSRPRQATPAALSLSDSSHDEVDTLTPPPITDHQQKEGNNKNQQASSLKRGRDEQHEEEEEKNDGICEPPTKKKTLHAVKQESPAKENNKKKAPKEIDAETVSTPLSSEKSAKKFARLWSPKDEFDFFNGLLVFFKRGKGLPKNLGPVFEHLRNNLDNQYSNRQFSDKISRWKAKFRANENKENRNTLSFKSTHEAAMYNVCKQLWGRHDKAGHGDDEYEEVDEDHSNEGNAKNVGKASMNGKEKEERKKFVVPMDENVGEDTQKAEDKEEQEAKEEEVEDGPQSKKAVAMTAVANDLAKPKTGSGQLSEELYRQFCKETDAMVNGLRNAAAMKVKETQLETMTTIQDFLNTRTDNLQLPNMERVNVFHSANVATLLSREKIEALEQKWRKQHILELEVSLRRFHLLQEECKISLEELRAPVRSGGY